jgi:hypothetical protein
MFQQRYRDRPIMTPAQQMVRELYEHGLTDQSMADICACASETINRIRHGRLSGRNLEKRIARVYGALQQNVADAGSR